MIVAIDGTVCSGKSTIARELSKNLGFTYLNTGAIYRALTLKLLRNSVSENDLSLVMQTINGTKIEQFMKDGKFVELMDGEDVTDIIRTPFVSDNVAKFAKIPKLREYTRKIQQDIGYNDDCVVEGRDIATVVFPNAEVKIFMTADLDVRAKRRLNDYETLGEHKELFEVKEEILKRDKMDEERDISPLKPCPDSIIYQNNGSDIKKVVDELSLIVNKRRGIND